jgi:hypothetical protein
MPMPSLFTMLIAAPAWAGGMVGVDLVPLGRADVAWVDQAKLSGTGVAETDGVLQPPLTAWAGVKGKQVATLFGLGVASSASTTWAGDPGGGDDLVTKRRIATVRPSVDLRWYPKSTAGTGLQPWVGAGLYVVAPFVNYRSDAWTVAEQKAWDDVAAEDRARLFAVGLRGGGGVEHRWASGLRAGARYFLVMHRAQEVDDDVVAASSAVRGEAALTLGFDL